MTLEEIKTKLTQHKDLAESSSKTNWYSWETRRHFEGKALAYAVCLALLDQLEDE